MYPFNKETNEQNKSWIKQNSC